ncbi:hypothetical protein K456DRAFT_1647988 [Colletotrichum gloeosporioides 23]|nr:hypothetical protein K456DRAFT_1647988 [Colletotrichum gloeosporioides 23]
MRRAVICLGKCVIKTSLAGRPLMRGLGKASQVTAISFGESTFRCVEPKANIVSAAVSQYLKVDKYDSIVVKSKIMRWLSVIHGDATLVALMSRHKVERRGAEHTERGHGQINCHDTANTPHCSPAGLRSDPESVRTRTRVAAFQPVRRLPPGNSGLLPLFSSSLLKREGARINTHSDSLDLSDFFSPGLFLLPRHLHHCWSWS